MSASSLIAPELGVHVVLTHLVGAKLATLRVDLLVGDVHLLLMAQLNLRQLLFLLVNDGFLVVDLLSCETHFTIPLHQD